MEGRGRNRQIQIGFWGQGRGRGPRPGPGAGKHKYSVVLNYADIEHYVYCNYLFTSLWRHIFWD